jgi:cytochrome c553
MKLIVPLTIVTLLLAACGREQDPAAPAEQPAAVDSGAAGKTLAEGKCANCHGLDGKGTGPGIPHLAGQKLAYLKSAMSEYRDGKRPHAALQQLVYQLSEADAANVAAYYASLPRVVPAGATPAAPGDADPLAEGMAAAAACASCHGADGNASTPGMPTLAGQHRGYLIASMQAYKDGVRKDPVMTAQMAGLNSLTIQNLAIYYAAQTPKGRGKPAKGDPAVGEPLSGVCGGCHGLKGQSTNAQTPALAGQDAQFLVKTMKNYRSGTRPHEEMKKQLAGLKDADLEHIAAFYAVQQPVKDQVKPSLTSQEWVSRCDRCHGPGADNPAMVAPYIEGQSSAYLEAALKAYRDGTRPQSAMHAMGMPLTDADITAIAEHYAGMAPR